jgi:predicted alpha/beta superfamily hydrolase
VLEETIVVGVGVPRAEGHLEFGLRRFEEFSPPADGYAFDDDLGRIFRSLFAVGGQDARKRLGLAPAFYGFLRDELVPQLLRQLPIDADSIGLLGHSAGGTFVGYALYQPDSPFRHYVGVSPGVGISGSWLMRCMDAQTLSRRASTTHFSLGSAEKKNAFNRIAGIPDTRAWVEQLRTRGLDVHYDCFDDETHSSVFPIAIHCALNKVFHRREADPQLTRRAS